MKEPHQGESTSKSIDNINRNLQDSGELTIDSCENEPESLGRWFGGVGSDFLHIANCLTDNVSPVVSGVASLVHKTAVAVANEIAQLERDGEIERDEAVDVKGTKKNPVEPVILPPTLFDSTSNQKNPGSLNFPFPWEICRESQGKEENDTTSIYFTDTNLKKKIVNLSRQDSTFLEPFSDDLPFGDENTLLSLYSSTYVMDDSRIKLIRRILDVDKNLRSMHNQLSGGDTDCWDTFFWKNYFFHCEKSRTDELRLREQRKSTNRSFAQESYKVKTSMEKIEHSVSDGACSDDSAESLIPVDSDIEELQDDNSSYVIQSAPNSLNTFTTTRSIDDDVVIVETFQKI